jgi:mannose-1-phosphate guanylyltransferase
MPAIMLSSMFVASELEGTQRDDTIIVMPIDFYVEQDYFDSIEKLTAAVQADIAVITLLGINPTYPSEKYGYIVPKSPNDTSDFKMVSSFKEKPDSETANQLISQGAFWNGGVFAFKLGYLLDIITKYTSSMSYQELSTNYGKLPKTSFDYGVAEKTTSVAVIPYSGMWKDLGTWNTLTEEMADAASGIAIIDESDTNVHVVNELIVPIVVTGLSDVIVAATPDGILVSSKEASVDIKDLIERIEVRRPMYEQRYWGEYHVLDWQLYDDGHRSLTKKICIREGAQLSYQRHALRSEIWTIVDGEGELVLEGIVTKVSSGDIINIAVGKMHAVRATKGALEFFEVQLGSELIEEDIERYGYFWNE